MSRKRTIGYAGPPFAAMHNELMGEQALGIRFQDFDTTRYPDTQLEHARGAWTERVQTEFRSIQIMSRFLNEIVRAGDPLDVYAAAVDFITDEIRHVALCASLVKTLGGEALMPSPVAEKPDMERLAMPAPAQALNTAISMLCINETLSVGFIADLHARCTDPVVHAVLDCTLADEDVHGDLGWTYVEKSLKRFNAESMPAWRKLVRLTLAPHEQRANDILSKMPLSQRTLSAWPEQELADLGLFSPQRQALVFEQTFSAEIEPRLRRLNLL